MFVLSSVVVIAASLQVITSQGPPDIPPQCRGPPQGAERPMDCCTIPNLFDANIFKECGFQMSEDGEGPVIGEHQGPPDCSKQKCLMEKSNLLKDGELDKEAAAALLQEWSATNSEFKPTVDTIKEMCLEHDPPGPPHLCQETKFMFCVGHNVFSRCPDTSQWKNSDGCQILKEHMEQCLPHFKKQ